MQQGILEDGVKVRFFKHAKLMGAQSDLAKRPVHEDRDFVEIKIVGEKDVFTCEARQEHKDRFPRAWEMYLRGNEVSHNGTTIESWPQMTPSQVLNLKAIGIYTVEELAAVSDANLSKLPDGRKLRESAISYLTRSAEAGAAAEVQGLREQVESLTAQGQEQAAQLAKSMELIQRMSEELKARDEAAAAAVPANAEAGAAAKPEKAAKQEKKAA